MRWDHLAPTAPEAVREAHRLLEIATEQLGALHERHHGDADSERRLRIAGNRIERARRLLERGMPEWSAGMTIHYGEHRYVSTYCQHALAIEAEGGPGDSAERMRAAGSLHQQCRRTCTTCGAPCRCTAPGCPCVAARNRGSVGVQSDQLPQAAPTED